MTIMRMMNSVQFIFTLLVWFCPCYSQEEESTSVIDILSSDGQFSIFLHHLQRSGLVPDLNMGSNNTVIAPINDAFDESSDEKFVVKYHLSPVLIESGNIEESSHLIYPSWLQSSRNQFVPLRVAKHQSHLELYDSRVIRADWRASNGIIQVVDSLLSPPPGPCHVLETSWTPYQDMYNPAKFSHFLAMIKARQLCHKSGGDSLVGSTFFLPTDVAISSLFNQIELHYLLSQHGQEDADFFIGAHVSPTLVYRQDLANSTTTLIHTMIEGRNLNLSASPAGMIVNGSETCFETDLIADDGVIHLVNSSLVSYKELNFTPLKYIYGLGCDSFGEELEFRRLASTLANDTSVDQTIFVPRNDDDDDDDDDDGSSLTSSSSKGLINTLKYHFVEGQIDLSKDWQLMTSKAHESHLGSNGQKIQLVRNGRQELLNGESEIIGDGPVKIGNTTIYQISQPLTLPGSARSVLGQIPHSSISYEYLKEWTRLIGEKNREGLTFFIPSNEAWKRLKMVRDLLEDDPQRLQQVMEGMILKRPVYTDKCNGIYETLAGTNVTIQCFEDGQKVTFGSTDGEAQVAADIVQGDILLNSGVAHLINEVPLPSDVNVTPRDLLRSVHLDILPGLLDARNLSYVLDKNASFTILAPLDRALRYDNITEDTDFIDTLLKLHVIETDPFDNFLKNGSSFKTLAGWKVSASKVSSGLYQLHFSSIGITVQVRILNKGRTSSGGMVYVLDREIFPDWLIKDSGSHIRTWIALLLGGVIGILLLAIALCISLCVTVFGGRKRRHLQEQEDNETSPLLLPPGSRPSNPRHQSRPEGTVPTRNNNNNNNNHYYNSTIESR